MNIECVGKGPPLLYLHDWGFNSQVWNHQTDHFRTRFRNCLVDFNLRSLPADLEHDAVIGHLCGRIMEGWSGDNPFAVLAHGFGAFLAYELIERGWLPERLILLGGLVRFTNDGKYLSGLAQETVLHMREELRESPPRLLADYYKKAFSGADETVPEELARAMPLHSAEFLKVSFDAMISHDYRELVAALPTHTLIVQGDQDLITPLWQAQLARRLLKNSELFLCHGAGHVPFYTRYAALNRRIGQFLERDEY